MHFRTNKLAIFIPILIAAMVSACSHLPWSGPSYKSNLKLKVAVMPFIDEAKVGGEPAELNTARLVAEELTKSKRLIVVPMEQVNQYLADNNVPKPLTQNTAAIVGRALGLNAIVLGSISEISQVQKREGYRRWLKFLFDRKDYVNAVLVAKVVDVESGIILGADIGAGAADTTELEKELWKSGSQESLQQTSIAASMDSAIISLAEAIEKALGQTRWKGFVVDVAEGQAVITAGEDVGVRAGDRFVSYAVGEKITNVAGQTYIIPGPVKAQLKAKSVEANSTRLEILEGEVSPGDSVEHVQ